MAIAQKMFGTSNIKLNVEYVTGSVFVGIGSRGQFARITSGQDANAINVVVTNQVLAGGAGKDRDIYTTLVPAQWLGGTSYPWSVFNTTAHELGHNFLGHAEMARTGTIDYFIKEFQVNAGISQQLNGNVIMSFRTGVEPRTWAVPVTPPKPSAK